MSLETSIKASPAYWVLGFIVVIGGSAWGAYDHLDGRYVRVADLASIKQSIKNQSLRADIGFAKNRILSLQDKVFDLEIKRNLNEAEQKQLKRYRAEIADLQREVDARERLLLKHE